PWRAMRMLLNLMLLADEPKPDDFVVDSLAVAESCRGMGVGTALLQQAEERARAMGKRTMSLGVIAENDGAIRLYERQGYDTTRKWHGFFVRLAFGSAEVLRMEKPLVADPQSHG
ncbi:MAG: GNAT family N-acetyltransferase, partial [Chloroflexota bacterium]|nr:GNAT family N-acetyltransferase [Chloroflexota bacterium]